jgi:hypothetical protein
MEITFRDAWEEGELTFFFSFFQVFFANNKFFFSHFQRRLRLPSILIIVCLCLTQQSSSANVFSNLIAANVNDLYTATFFAFKDSHFNKINLNGTKFGLGSLVGNMALLFGGKQ